jgi:hypothetical protein
MPARGLRLLCACALGAAFFAGVMPTPARAATPKAASRKVTANSVAAFGTTWLGDPSDGVLAAPIVGLATTPDGAGYWLVSSDGGVFTYGDERFFGSAGNMQLNSPIVGMAATPDAGGYWLVASDGGVFTYGDAAFQGSELGDANTPAVGIAAVAHGGYLVAYGQAPDPLGPAAAAYVATRAGNVTAAVYDADTGALFQLNPGDAEQTASIVKVDIMATALQEDERNGGGIPAAQMALMAPMIEQSDNDDASSPWNDVGGAPAVAGTTRTSIWGRPTRTWPGVSPRPRHPIR